MSSEISDDVYMYVYGLAAHPIPEGLLAGHRTKMTGEWRVVANSQRSTKFASCELRVAGVVAYQRLPSPWCLCAESWVS